MEQATRTRWQTLAHRWFVQYNPLYLVSAAMVLVGVFLMSRGLSRTEGLMAELWLTGVTELYQVLLIGGAALLYRVGQRRPAVMLALLEAVYLGDLTFQTGVSPLLGTVGVVASAAWYALFLIKLRTLAWAVRVEVSWSTWLLISTGGAVLTVTPHLLYATGKDANMQLLAACAFGLSAGWRWFGGGLRSLETLDAWGRTVVRRVQWVGWQVWGALLLGHMFWWCGEHNLSLVPVLAGALLPMLAHRLRSELEVWGLAAATLAVGLYHPEVPLPLAATLVACALSLRAWRGPGFGTEAGEPEAAADLNPYRMAPSWDEPRPPLKPRRPHYPTRAERLRLVVGILCCGYASVFSSLWASAGCIKDMAPLPLDLVTALLLLLLITRAHSRLALLPMGALLAKYGVLLGVIFMPRGPLQWGAVMLTLGFASLLTGLGLNWRWRGGQERTEG